MADMAIIGARDSILGFKALGLSVYPVKTSEEAEKILTKLVQENFASIFITEDYAANMLKRIEELEKEIELYPSIVIIPSFKGSKGLGMEKVRKMIEKAVGIDLLSSERGDS
ncbi:MAG: V-type ATP synthase subunit F [Nitrospinota bacterium]|nr:V-type ATP synthase subunit F [Nitrospinota bacterium]